MKVVIVTHFMWDPPAVEVFLSRKGAVDSIYDAMAEDTEYTGSVTLTGHGPTELADKLLSEFLSGELDEDFTLCEKDEYQAVFSVQEMEAQP